MRADIGMVNSGSFRSDSIEHEGEITRHTIDTILPFKDQVLVVAYTGLEVLQVLETSVSDYPHLVGKFCQVSGIKFSFDPRKPPGKRVIRGSVQCRNRDGAIQPLQETTVYKCAMKTFIFEGKDGYPQGDPSKVIQKAEKCVSDMIFEFLKGQHRENGELELLVPRIAPAAEGRIVCVHPNETLLHAYGDI